MNLVEARWKIDKIDSELKKLFAERMEVSKEIAMIKAETGDNIYKPDREKEVIEKLTAYVNPDIKEEYTAFIRKILEISRDYQLKKINELKAENQ
ncbi:MAG: chorismate mutase [Eubacterium sp.]|nr:chorismate mutase [Eubacterium sp.]MBR1674799.1 chorismate mutase [Eubacterium sp.]